MDGIYMNVVFLPPGMEHLPPSMYIAATQGSLRATLPPGMGTFTTLDVHCLNSGVPPGNPEQSPIFKPVSKATKAMEIGPKATRNHEKSTLESKEIQFL